MTGLSASTAFSVRVKACNSEGLCSTNSANIAVTTLNDVLPAPAVPSGLAASSISQNSFTLNWAPISGASTYKVSEASSKFAEISVGTNFQVVSGLNANTAFSVRVKACNSQGLCSANSSNLSVSTSAAPVEPSPNFTPITVESTPATIKVVHVSAVAQKNANKITLNWDNVAGAVKYSTKIYKKLVSDSNWGSAIDVDVSLNSWTDTSVVVGQMYDYKIVAEAHYGTSYGNIASGIELPAESYNGKIILVVDTGVSSFLTTQLAALEQDMLASGWIPIRKSIDRENSVSATVLRNLLITEYNKDPAHVKAALLIGHVPVPYTKGVNPDGHGNTDWPTDAYYAELTSNWSSNSGNDPIHLGLQGTIPSEVELQVGRIDMAGMSSFPGNEPEQITSYLNKLHAFKTKSFVPQNKGLLIDNFVGNDFASNGYRAMSTSVGAANVLAFDPLSNGNGMNCPTNPHPALGSQTYLWGYTCGGGGGTSMAGVSCTDQMDNINLGSVFNMAFGSYFGNWNGGDSYLRSYLLSGKGLTNAWAGTLNWWVQHMSMGKTIGYSTQVTMNNRIKNMYQPLRATSWGGDNKDSYITLLGDPTLTLFQVAPPSNLAVSNSGGKLKFDWSASSESGLAGYHVYEIGTNEITRITSTPVSGTSFTSSVNFASGKKFMVRAVKLQITKSGSYFNQSLGAIKSN